MAPLVRAEGPPVEPNPPGGLPRERADTALLKPLAAAG